MVEGLLQRLPHPLGLVAAGAGVGDRCAAAAALPMGLVAAGAGVGDWCAAVAPSNVLVAGVGDWCG